MGGKPEAEAMLSEVACQHCEAAGLEVQADGAVKCRYCGKKLKKIMDAPYFKVK